MHVVIIRDRGELALAAPFVRIANWIGTVKLVPMDSLTPQYNDILVAEDDRLPSLWGELRAHFRRNFRIRSVRLSGVRADSTTARLLQSIGATRTWSTVAQAINLEPFPTAEAFFESRSSNTRYNFRRQVRTLERHGTVRFRRIGAGPELEPAIHWIFERKDKWVKRKFAGPNWISADGTADFFSDIASVEAERGGAYVTAIELNELLIGALLIFRQGGTIFASKIAYDPAWQKLSPGWLVLMRSLLDSCDDGGQSFDLMMGSDRWKDRIGGNCVPVANYRVDTPIFPV
jgi:CelD/BcsL family acetyltransferase involved in cellulose biosynthesis